ncbi:MAG: thioredoxin family protein [Armatimonadota bacterium]
MSLKIEVLGPSCDRCYALENNVKQAVQQLGINAEIEHVTNIQELIKRLRQYRAMVTPVLVVNGKVLSQGKVPSVAEIVQMLTTYLATQVG